MEKVQFPIFKTKIEGTSKTFNLIDPKDCQAYFELKVGPEIKKIREYLKNNSFIAYLLGKKNAGKGTYSKIFAEIIDPKRIFHFSIGDMIREIGKELKDKKRRKELISFLEKNYRGWISLEEAISALEKRDTKTLTVPTELLLFLVERKIAKMEKKTLFIDGFPRDLDQISFSLFFRNLIGYREDPDIFILIDAPEAVIDERIKHRRICPLCKTPKNLKLLPTSKIEYDQRQGEFHLICDNPSCQGEKMIQKEGDELGIGPIRKRLDVDEKLIKQALSLYGVPKILLRNSIPIAEAKNYVDDYEITPEYSYEWVPEKGRVKINEKPWQVIDGEGVPSFSLLPSPVVVSLIKQMADVLELT